MSPTIRIEPQRGLEVVQVSSKIVCNYFRHIGFNPKIRTIPVWIQKSEEYTKAAIRGLFDTEGSIGFKYYRSKKGISTYKQLTFTNTNRHILDFTKKSLLKMGFKPTLGMSKNIYISNKTDIEKYFSIVGTGNPKLEKKYKIK